MTRLSVGFGRGFPRVWLLPIGVLTLVLGIAAVGTLSRSIVADLLAWWPVWLGIAVVAYLLRERKLGQFRVAGIVPLVALVVVGLFIWGHLAGWSMMPSASQRLVGPEVGGFSAASLRAEVGGVIEVGGGSEFLYQVEPVMRGGRLGIPGANEQVADSSIAVVLAPPSDPGLYTYAGWDVRLADQPRWSLTLDGVVDADLTSLNFDALSVAGEGRALLGNADGETPVLVSGEFQLVVPAGAPVRVVGVASVPDTWRLDGEGALSPSFGEGWVITVAPDADVSVVEGRSASQ